MDRSKGLVVADPNTGRARTIRPTGSWCGSCSFVRIGKRLYGTDGTSLYALDLRTLHAERIGKATGVGVFTASSNRAVYVAGSKTVLGAESLQLVGINGASLGGPWRVPAGYTLTTPPRAVSGGVVIESNENAFRRQLAFWNPATDALQPLGTLWSLIDTYTAADATESIIARLDCSDFPCPLLLTDTATGTTRQIEAPSGANGFFAGGAFSPDGARLALFVATSHPANVNPAVELAIVNVSTGSLEVVERSGVGVGEPFGYAVWSSSGRWVFFGGLSEKVLVYRRGGQRARPLPKIPGNYSIAALP